MQQYYHRPGFATLLNVLLPGLGHVYWREYLFGIFIFLVMLIAMTLLQFSYIADLSLTPRLILFGLPVIFYVFTFVDLWRSIRKKKSPARKGASFAVILLLGGLLFNILFPLSPTNFALRNHPAVIASSDRSVAPVIEEGTLCLVDRQAYRVDLFFLNKPFRYHSPQRWDVVRFADSSGQSRSALVVALPNEHAALVNDTLFINGYPLDRAGPTPDLSGSLALTAVEPWSILAVTFDEGVIARAWDIPLGDITGRVYPLF